MWGTKIIRSIWGLTADFIMELPFRAVRTLYCKLFFKSMGKNVYIGKGLDIREPSKICIGNNVCIGKRVVLDGRNGLNISNNVDIAQECCLWSTQHNYNDDFHSLEGEEIIIEDYVWLCTRSTILPGITIRKGAVVATGAVVTRDVEPMTVVGGCPAKKISNRKSKLLYEVHFNPRFYQKI